MRGVEGTWKKGKMYTDYRCNQQTEPENIFKYEIFPYVKAKTTSHRPGGNGKAPEGRKALHKTAYT